jgi:uncharacterized protein
MIASLLLALALADPQITAAIAKIKAIDHHAHPPRVTAPGEIDTDVDALSIDGIEMTAPMPLRPDNPELVRAWRALYGYRYHDRKPEHVAELIAAKERVMKREGDRYPRWVLDQAKIETMFANRIALGRGLTPPRFRWIAFDDALLFPLDNSAAKSANPERDHFFRDEEHLLKRYLGDAPLPATFGAYLHDVVTATLERQKHEGALGVKFEAGYLRPLDFSNPSAADAARVYERWIGGGVPPADDYKLLQDFLFRYIAREAGRLGMAVHIHVIGGGVGTYYDVGGSNPTLLDSVFNDPALRKTNFVMIHGGYPWAREVAMLFAKPNVYADFSAQTFLLYPRELSAVLRVWLEAHPEKVLFGTDCGPGAPEQSWEEQAWMTSRTARTALAIALSGMVDDGEITRARAIELARMVLRGNAIQLYNLPVSAR